MRPPVTPSGWPNAMAPPFGLIRSSLSAKPSSRVQAKTCAAKASFSSMISISSNVRPALASAFFDASTGPIPIIRGSTPATAELTTRAKGFNPCCSTASPLAINNATAPSFNPELLPAVTEPSFLNAALRPPRASRVVFGFMNSSSTKTIGSFLRCGISTANFSKRNLPRSCALAAFCCDQSAKASWSSRLIPNCSTRFSAVSPMA